MSRRALTFLSLALYGASQISVLLHGLEPHEEPSCSRTNAEWTARCETRDCEAPTHHHHRHTHDPATCHTCSGTVDTAPPAREEFLPSFLTQGHPESPTVLSHDVSEQKDHHPRGPPILLV